jgi:hypothetical protein
MVTLHQVYAGEELAAMQLVREVEDAGEGVAVVYHRQVESEVVAAGPPRPVLLAYQLQWRRPGRIGTADDACRLQLAELGFRLAQLVRVQAVGLGEHRAACRLDDVADFVLRRWYSFPVAGNEANRDRTDGAMEQRAAANLERSVPAAVDGLESRFRVFESSTWRPTGSTSSQWADKKSKPRMGLYTGASKKMTKKVRSPNDRRWQTLPQHGMALPSAPES